MSSKTRIITLIAVLFVCLGLILYGTIREEASVQEVLPRTILMVLSAVVLIVRIASSDPGKQTSGQTKQDTAGAATPFEVKILPLDEIWQIREKDQFVNEMWQYIAHKCGYDDNMEALNEEQRALYIVRILEAEVNNGGFSQFFFNSSGIFANELVDAFQKIGADKMAEICKKAVSIYGDEVPADREKREELLSSDNEEQDEKIAAVLTECDDAFYACEDDLNELCYQFIIDHKMLFSE